MTDDPKQEQLSGYQVQQIRLAVQSEVARIIKDVELRKWCVQETLKCANVQDVDMMLKTLEKFYAFITALIKAPPSE